jgi:hypothetical protein
MHRAIILALLVALSGCSTTWNKTGATQQSFEIDKHACLLESGGLVTPLYESCMRAKGYTTNNPQWGH